MRQMVSVVGGKQRISAVPPQAPLPQAMRMAGHQLAHTPAACSHSTRPRCYNTLMLSPAVTRSPSRVVCAFLVASTFG